VGTHFLAALDHSNAAVPVHRSPFTVHVVERLLPFPFETKFPPCP
jgi:hypothetical protein